MIIELQDAPGKVQFDSTQGIDLSIAVSFNTPVLAFGVPAPTKTIYKAGSYVGSVEQGGNSNCDTIEFNPHCHGTHTECIGHITNRKILVRDALEENIFLTKVVTIDCSQNPEITRAQIEKSGDLSGAKALIIRTVPNDISKKMMKYDESAPYISAQAMEWISSKDISHLLFDSPSVDPIWDGGKMAAHRVFWNIESGQKDPSVNSHLYRTITELLYVPNHVKDGFYVLDLQTSHFELDAVPSKPIIFPVISWRQS